MQAEADGGFDHDVVVIGSGFGGSVAALRLAAKGYRVHVYEAGRRFADGDFAKTSWDVRNYLWAPTLKCFGPQRFHKLPDVMLLAGAGVGGGSLNYANVLYVPGASFFADKQWAGITDWQNELAPHYETAKRMLGVVEHYPYDGPGERVMARVADRLGVSATFRKTPVGVFFGTPGQTVPDPFFGGDGPSRTACTLCGNCMVGCRVGAKNTLVKNYLYLAEKLGAEVEPLRTVVSVKPLIGGGYAVTTEATGAWFAKDRRTVTAEQIVFAAGAWGTQKLLHALKERGELPALSPALGRLTRTNSEALDGAMLVSAPKGVDLTQGVAITTTLYVDEVTHVQNVRYGHGSNAIAFLTTALTPGGQSLTKSLGFIIGKHLVHPLRQLRLDAPRKMTDRGMIALVMQRVDNSITVSAKRGWFGRIGLTSRQGEGEPNPTYLPGAHRAVRAMAEELEAETGIPAEPRGTWLEAMGVPLTAHFLGGAVISDSPQTGVVDAYHRVWGYPGLHVVDGSAVSANPGVNPSLTITAQAERAFALWPAKGEPDRRPAQGDPYRKIETTTSQLQYTATRSAR